MHVAPSSDWLTLFLSPAFFLCLAGFKRKLVPPETVCTGNGCAIDQSFSGSALPLEGTNRYMYYAFHTPTQIVIRSTFVKDKGTGIIFKYARSVAPIKLRVFVSLHAKKQ